MSSSSEHGSDNGTPTPGNESFRSQSSGSNSPTPSPSSRSSSIRHNTNVNLNSDENDFQLSNSKCTSPNGYHTPETEDAATTPPTPPRPNEGESLDNPGESDEKLNKSNGRLKFFKDGMLCLELSHHDEGQKTKWIQVRGKSVIPQIVQVTKEAKIPCQLTQQSLFSTPNSNHVQSSSRVESSTSHSMSDDGSSILSSASPRLRDSTWRKQPVPQRCLSVNSNFYMKPASCVVSLNFRQDVQVKARLCTLRRPYSMPDFVNLFREKVVPGVSKCGLNTSSGNSSCLCDSFSVVANSKTLVNGENSKLRAETNKKVSMQLIEKRLSDLVEIRLKFKREKEVELRGCLKNNNSNLSSPRTLVKPTSTKSAKGEVRGRDSMPGFHPIISNKKSQQRNVEKTILSVPGHGTIFKKRHNDIDTKHNLSLIQPLNFAKPSRPHTISGEDTTDGKTVDLSISDKHRNRNSKDTPRQRNDRKSKTTNSHIAKSSSSSTSILKPNIRPTEQVTDYSNSYRLHPFSEPNIKSAMPYSPPPSSSMNKSQPDHDKYLQKQTVSKVISYTINSLLGTDSSNGTSPINSKSGVRKHIFTNESPPLKDLSHSSSRRSSSEVENNKETTNAKTNVQPFSMGDQDQSSFLRHLLDTSDPIPSLQQATSTASPSSKIHPTTPKKRSAINNHNSSNNTSPSKSRRSPKSQNVNSESTSILIAKPVSSTNSVQPSFTGPKHTAHERSSGGGMPTSTYHHYASLLPPTFIPSLHTSNPYFDPPESRTSSHPIPHLNYTGDTALNLSHRGGWPPPFFLPPSFSSFHDRASPTGCQDLSMNRRNVSPFSESHGGSNNTDNDLPLNLCKKPRPN